MTRRLAAALLALVLTGVSVPIIYPPDLFETADEGGALCTPAVLGALTFPTSALTGRLRIAFGADPTTDPNTWAWTEVTDYLRHQDRVVISFGRDSEGQFSAPATMRLALNSDDGRFMPGMATGANYPYVQLGTPIEWYVNPGNGWYERFSGFVSSWSPRWDLTGTQTIVDVQASGVSRRIGQGAAERTPIERAIHETAPEAYWTLGDGSDATFAGSAVGGYPMTVQLGTVEFAAFTDLNPDMPTPDLDAGSLVGTVTGVSSDAWHVELFLRSDAYNTSAVSRIYLSGGTIDRLFFSLQNGDASAGTVFVVDRDENVIGAIALPLLSQAAFLGDWHHYAITIEQSGTSVRVRSYMNGVLSDTATMASETLGSPSQVLLGHNIGTPTSAAHLAIGSTVTFSTAFDAADEFDGETTATRFARVCAQESVVYTVDTGTTSSMGPQRAGSTLDELREVEAVEHGMVTDYRFGSRLIPRSARYNRAPDLELDTGELGETPRPTLDDLGAVNEARVSRTDGEEVTYQDRTDIARRGRYDTDASINAVADELVHHAEWLVHLGTVEGMRYPDLTLNLRRTPELIQAWCNAGLGARLRVTGLPASHPVDGIDVYVEGYTETFDSNRWIVEINASPARPYEVFQVESATLGRLDSAGSTLDSAISSSATSLSVATPDDPLWSTAAADYPCTAEVGGEEITVTAVSGASSPQTFTVTRSTNGVVKSHAAGTTVRLWRPGQVAL